MGLKIMFHTFENRTTITGELVLTLGLHIGAGSGSRPDRSDNPVIRDANGQPFIPGSSLKGVVRSFCERLLYTLNHPDWTACLITSQVGHCLSAKCYETELEEMKTQYARNEIDDVEYTRFVLCHSCRVCQLFGSTHLASKIHFRDGQLKELAADIHSRDGVAIERDTRTAAEHLKFDFEVVPPGSKFEMKVIAENTDDAELGLLFMALRQLEKDEITIGGMASRGLGGVKMTNVSIQHVNGHNSDALLDYLAVLHKSGKEGVPPGQVADPAAFMQQKIDVLVKQLKRKGDDDAQVSGE